MNLNIELPLNIHKNVVIEQKANIYNIILCSIAKKKRAGGGADFLIFQDLK